MALTKISSTNIEAGAIEASSLETSGVTAASYGSASEVPVITVNAQGLITAASTTTVAGVTDFDYNTSTGVLDIDTADGSNFSTTVTLAPFDTADLAEGTNLYYTDARVASYLTSNSYATQSYADQAEADAITSANSYTDTEVASAISNLINSAPTALDTLDELAAALGDDANFASTVTTNLAGKTDKTTTVSAGTGLSGGGDLSTNRTFSISNTGVTAGSYGTSTAIPVLTINAQGQVTAASTTNITVGDGTLTVNTGSGLTGSGTFTANQTTAGTITLSHADTSSQASVNNSGGTVIQDVTVDGFGHVTGLASVDLTTQFLGINAKATDSDALDGLNSTQFLRSDADDTATGYVDFSTGLRAGEIAIGGTSSASASYNVTIKTIDGNPLYLQYDSDQDVHIGQSSNPSSLLVSGNVGIGTNSPSVYGHGGTNKFLEIQNTGTAANSQSHVILTTGSVTPGSIGTITWTAKNSSGSDKRVAMIAGRVESDSTSGTYGQLRLGTWNNSSYQDVITIDSSRNVGIGTASPDQLLHLRRASGSDTAGSGHIILDVADDAGPAWAVRVGDTGDDGDLSIDSRWNGNWDNQLKIDRVYGSVTLDGNSLNLPVAASDPSTGIRAGALYYNSTTNGLRYYNGNSWQNVSDPTDPTSNDAYVRYGFNNSNTSSGLSATALSLGGSYSYTTSSKIGTHALDFGTNQTGFGDISTGNTGTTFSMGGWFYIYRANTAGRSYIVDFRTSNSSAGYWLFDNLDSMTVKRHDAEEVFSYNVPTNQWVHWVLTSGSTFKFYVNGSVYRTGSTYSDNLSNTITLGTYFGARNGSGQYFMNSRVDNFFLSYTEYTANQVLEIYQSQVDY